METIRIHFFLLICLAFSSVATSDEEISRSQFPHTFLFGTATSSFQIEGAAYEDGKGLNNWDVFCHFPGSIKNGDNADVTDDHYHRYKEDIDLMSSLGVNAYRFSISWARILPRGRFGDVNSEGIMFYNKLLDYLLLKGIEPFVTLHHFDIPQELEDKYGSWLSPLIQDDFAYFADICFKSFGDRVKYWATINESVLFVYLAYFTQLYPPGRYCAILGNCSSGNPIMDPMFAVHNMILSHAKATNIYRKHYQLSQGGYIGAVVSAPMVEPFSDEEADYEATKRALAFKVAWFLDPLIHGDYPPEMRRLLGNQLPKLSRDEIEMLKDGLDFIGVNHYTSLYAKDCIKSLNDPTCDVLQGAVHATGERDGAFIGERTGMPSIYVVPTGMEKIIRYLKERYNNTPMIVTENGYPQEDSEEDLLNDFKRVKYHKSYLSSLARAIKEGADVRGYFVWSLMDNFEWTYGYSLRFGLHHVDFKTLQRTPKLSAIWYRSFLTENNTGFDIDQNTEWANV